MSTWAIVVLLCALKITSGNVYEDLYNDNRRLAKILVECLQDPEMNEQLLFDLKKENQVHLNRTMALVIKYIVKREVDNYRMRRTDAISRRIYSSLVMKLIDIAKDMPRNTSVVKRVETAYRYYMTVENRDEHDKMADSQLFHACLRLYDIMYTAPRILLALGNLDELTPKTLIRKLSLIQVKPVHLAIALLVQFHLRSAVNYAISTSVVDTLATKPEMVGPRVLQTLALVAARLLPVCELLDLHLAHSSPLFRDDSPSTWLGIVNMAS